MSSTSLRSAPGLLAELPPEHGRQRRKQARPQELLDAALEVFVERGFAASRCDDVAARAGVSKGTLYLYYDSKEELLKAVIRHHLSDEIAAAVAQAHSFTGPTPQLLSELIVQRWQRLVDGPSSGVFKLIITEMRNFPEIAELYAHEVVEPGQRLIGDILQRGIDRGELRPIDVPSAVRSLITPMIMLCLHKHTIGACALQTPVDTRLFIRQHVELMLHGMLAPPG
jgi:AcrR family transcriptional regulator